MSRLTVKKTYKLFIGGKFPRSESGRTLTLADGKGGFVANISRASRKDFRNAVEAAEKAQAAWAGTTAYLKGQILYRVAEVLEGRAGQFVAELKEQGWTKARAEKEVEAAIDLWVHYAGWSDKYSAVFSSVNPVAGPHVNFSVPEPVGVVAGIVNNKGGLLALSACLAPLIVGGNSVVVLASEKAPLSAISLAEVLATSDVPGGVVNILTGQRAELLSEMAKHMAVKGLWLPEASDEERKTAGELAAENLKRVSFAEETGPERIMDFQEIKTTWHPVGV
ncbi:MAG: aldehyde dehydrogenase family protein [Verrucomicrobiales bacterium]